MTTTRPDTARNDDPRTPAEIEADLAPFRGMAYAAAAAAAAWLILILIVVALVRAI